MPKTPRDVAQAYADCLIEGDFDRLVSLHHPGMVCSLLGDTRVSGRYVGRDAFFAHTFEHVLGQLIQGDDQYLTEARVACASGEYAVLLLRGGLPSRVGGVYDQNYMQCFRVVAGKVVENHEFLDSTMLETQVYGKHLVHPRQPPKQALAPGRRAPNPTNNGMPVAPVAAAFIAALQARNVEPLLATLAPDVVVQIAGWNPHSGVVHGKPETARRLADELEAYRAGTLHWQAGPRLVCQDDEAFCVLGEMTAQMADGRIYLQTIGILAQCRAGAINEIYVYFDTAAQERQRWNNPLIEENCERAVPPLSITAADIDDIIETSGEDL